MHVVQKKSDGVNNSTTLQQQQQQNHEENAEHEIAHASLDSSKKFICFLIVFFCVFK